MPRPVTTNWRLLAGEVAKEKKRHHEPNVRRLPLTRGDCVDGPRPCPFVSCRHHLALDVVNGGSLKVNFPDIEPGDLPQSCSLDIADRGPMTLESVGETMNLVREAVRIIGDKALVKVNRSRTPEVEEMLDGRERGRVGSIAHARVLRRAARTADLGPDGSSVSGFPEERVSEMRLIGVEAEGVDDG